MNIFLNKSKISAYQNNDINEFESILKENQSIMEDTFIREHIEGILSFFLSSDLYLMRNRNICFLFLKDLLRNIRTQVLIKLIKPYTKIHIPFIAKVSFFLLMKF